MIDYALNHADKLGEALWEHILLVALTLLFSIAAASLLSLLAMYVPVISRPIVYLFSILYAVPSLALFVLLIPLTGLGQKTAILVLILYNQYILLRNFLTGLTDLDPSIVEAATGMGMNRWQTLFQVRLPLARRSIFTGIRLASVSTVGIATIAAFINAGGLGDILFDGLRTLNIDKIIWGSILSAGLALLINALFLYIEKRLTPPAAKL
ncbi:ABC transporter permease [Paenibacillus shenyangensis]|uniref:ABC transporter permease n=1 Tax=Paenibacillus sp. A9 TaxID=1284352 RepID=UPI00037AB1FC|nr:ABC transporter permease [Paenibacillus sp. A9]